MRMTLICSIMLAILSSSSAAFAQPPTFEAVDANDLSGASQGAAWLRRSDEELHGRVMVNVEVAGAPYTVWWVIINRPENCATSPCTPADFSNPAVGFARVYGSGVISASDGAGGAVVNADLWLTAAEPTGGPDEPCCSGQLDRGNGRDAEVRIVVDAHPTFDSWVEDLTTPETSVRIAIFAIPQDGGGEEEPPSLVGERLTYQWLFGTLVVEGPTTFSVGAGPELRDVTFSSIDVNVSATNLRLDFTQGLVFTLTSLFNGHQYTDADGTAPAFTSVTINSDTTVAGFDASRISFDANTIRLDFTGLSVSAGAVLSLDIGLAP